MRCSLKVGFSVMSVGLLLWAIPTFRYYYPTWTALKSPLPVAPGGVLRETFRVHTSERYSIDLVCREVGQFKEAWKDFLNSQKHPTLDCDISLRLLHDGREICSERLRSLRPASYSGTTAFWAMARVELPSSGRYDLVLTNHTDISYLRPTTPMVQVYLDAYYHKEVGTWSALGLFAGAPVFLLGLGIFIRGLLK